MVHYLILRVPSTIVSTVKQLYEATCDWFSDVQSFNLISLTASWCWRQKDYARGDEEYKDLSLESVTEQFNSELYVVYSPYITRKSLEKSILGGRY
jgi:hypothetical protein